MMCVVYKHHHALLPPTAARVTLAPLLLPTGWSSTPGRRLTCTAPGTAAAPACGCCGACEQSAAHGCPGASTHNAHEVHRGGRHPEGPPLFQCRQRVSAPLGWVVRQAAPPGERPGEDGADDDGPQHQLVGHHLGRVAGQPGRKGQAWGRGELGVEEAVPEVLQRPVIHQAKQAQPPRAGQVKGQAPRGAGAACLPAVLKRLGAGGGGRA
jgi:hypothetical protein